MIAEIAFHCAHVLSVDAFSFRFIQHFIILSHIPKFALSKNQQANRNNWQFVWFEQEIEFDHRQQTTEIMKTRHINDRKNDAILYKSIDRSVVF